MRILWLFKQNSCWIKDKTSFVAIEKFVALNPKIYSFSVNNSEYEKENDANKMLQQEWAIVNIKMFSWIINNWGIW